MTPQTTQEGADLEVRFRGHVEYACGRTQHPAAVPWNRKGLPDLPFRGESTPGLGANVMLDLTAADLVGQIQCSS